MPTVSIIIPCYNEEKTIGMLLEAIHQQSYPLDEIEVIISDGMSEDKTRVEILKFCSTHPDLNVQIIDNQRRNIPAALNSAIKVAKGKYIVRLDAHSKPEKAYIERSIKSLQEGRGDNIGGIWLIEPGGEGRIPRAIALAAAHPLGVGDAYYRFASEAGEVDTVPFGAFRRDLVDEIGGYDESLLTNEDYEFNTRIRQHGGKVWLDPQIRSVYFARSTLGALSRQYYRYGYWKWRMLKRYPGTLRYRQALPPLFVLSLILLAIVAPFWWLAAAGLLVEVVLYIGILKVASIRLARKNKDFWLIAAIPLAIATMHICWGWGFWVSLISFRKS